MSADGDQSWILVSKQANIGNQTSWKADFGLNMIIYLDIHETC